ncbi:MAG: lipopolysaccharide biosynthesis protein RfbH [Planctomycetota bacterium]|nr:lipopolysaccharide biosynthesis protein RfbH [Planctomycetota bacterium]MCX8040085.1 lipopolysaccharide biosynthesis protein RfbH [Planctomycetota bacterium]
MNNSEAELRAEILAKTRELVTRRLATSIFVPGSTVVPYAGRVYDAEEVAAAVESVLDFWLTLGPEGDAFERELAAKLGVRSSVLTNSGSSANLLAIAALTSHKLGERRLRPGDEVITVAAGFPTTVAPIIQCDLTPVFIDVDPITLGPRVDQLEEAYVPGKTKALIFAHALGNPFDLDAVASFCREKGLWLIEDNCDSLGSTWGGKPTGSFGDLSTQSFYPPHHITMGEGGAVNIVRDPKLRVIVESFRDWGRDCWCPSGKDNTCKRRFEWKLGDLPAGYDHKYIYSHLGWNLKPLDVQAAIGRQQLKKLDRFTAARRANWHRLRTALADLEDRLDFMLPAHATGWSPAGFTWKPGGTPSDPSWFGFMMLVKAGPAARTALARALDAAKIGNRMFFGGNLVRQPAFVHLREERGSAAFRVVSDLAGADRVMNEALFVGTYPGLDEQRIDYVAAVIRNAITGT